MEKRKIKWDICLLAGMLLAALLTFSGYNLLNMEEADFAVVFQDGEVIARYPLSEDHAETVACGENGYNRLMVSGGEVFVSDADCPDRLCVEQKAISRKGESIICLPHKLVVLIDSKEEGEVDAVAN